MGDGVVDSDSAFSFSIEKESGFPTKETKTPARKGSKTRGRISKAKYDELKGTIAGVGTGVWATAGHLISTQIDPEINPAAGPTGKMMQLQAPAAGKRIANILERTPLMNLLAPVLGTKGIIGDIQALVLPPLIVYVASSKPEFRESPIAQTVITAMMVPIAKEIIAAQNEQANSVSLFGEMDEETTNVISEMMNAIFDSSESTDGNNS